MVSFPSSLVFYGSIPTCAFFHSENFFCDLFLLFFFVGMVRKREVGGEAKGKVWFCMSRSLEYIIITVFMVSEMLQFS